MFGRKQRIIETQAALISDLREEIEHKDMLISKQRKRIATLQDMLSVNGGFTTSHFVGNIDFPNSEKGGSDHTGSVNVSDILNL